MVIPTKEWHMDITADEIRRRELMLQACPDFDPAAAMASEDAAIALLYGNLDEQQQKTFDMLVEAGVLPVGPNG